MDLAGLVGSCRMHAVAALVPEEGNVLRLYFHEDEGFRIEELPFRRFVIVSDPQQLTTPCAITALGGNFPLRYLAEFDSAAAYRQGLDELRSSRQGWHFFRDPVRQALIRCRVRLFSGVSFAELRRLALAAEGDDRLITALEAADGAEVRRFEAATPEEERKLLEELAALVSERDPDVIEGLDLGGRIFPMLEKAFKRHKLAFALGRGGGAVTRAPGSFTLPEGQVRCTVYRAPGRNIVDTTILVRLYDARTRVLESWDLDDLKAHFDLPGDTAAEQVHALGGILAPAYFYQTQILPIDYQELPLRGNGSNLDSLFIAEYLGFGHSLPFPDAPQEFQGALTRSERQGVFHRVRHVDVRSLYPSILLAGDLSPARDTLHLFQKYLRELRRFRLAAKDAAKRAESSEEARDLNALQSAFKILINSFYGYLGFAQGAFNDYELAAEVTRQGRAILNAMLDHLASVGAAVIEADTDGIYFQMPEQADGAEFDAALRQVLPPGIEVDFDAEYPAMFAYKSKNYALLRDDGTVTLTGAALKSRALEPFQREFIMAAVTHLLDGTAEKIADEYAELRRRIENRELPLEKFAKTETLNDSPANYRKKLESGSGRHSAAYDLVLEAGLDCRAGDKVRFYVTGTQKRPKLTGNTRLLRSSEGERDENVAYYLDKLDALYANYQPFIK